MKPIPEVEAIEKARETLRVPITTLCRRAKISRNTYHRLISGKARNPTRDTTTGLHIALLGFQAEQREVVGGSSDLVPAGQPTGRDTP